MAADEHRPKKTSFSAGSELSGKPKPDSSWKLPPRYEVKKILGKGSYGQVCEALDSVGNRKVAIKRVKNLFSELTDCKRILREISIMSRLQYKHIVQILDIAAPSDISRFNEIYIVMECVDTDLKKLCRDPNISISWAHINTLLYNLLLGLKYIHSAGVYHRDLTPGNCLVNKDLTIKICDFGLSRAIGAERLGHVPVQKDPDPEGHEREMTAHVVTRWYRAPELILVRDHYTEAVDVWSAGCIFAELIPLLTGAPKEDRRPLFPGSTCFPMSPDPEHEGEAKFHTCAKSKDQLHMIFNILGTLSDADMKVQDSDVKRYLARFTERKGTGFKEKFPYAEDNAVNMLESMLQFLPGKRITVEDALRHKLFDEVREEDKEKSAVAPSLVNLLEFEKQQDPDEAFLRRFFLKEIRTFHPELPMAL